MERKESPGREAWKLSDVRIVPVKDTLFNDSAVKTYTDLDLTVPLTGHRVVPEADTDPNKLWFDTKARYLVLPDLMDARRARQAKAKQLLAEAHAAVGRNREAAAAAQQATELTRWPAVVFSAARVLLQTGGTETALAAATDLKSRLAADLQSLGLLLEGEHELDNVQ